MELAGRHVAGGDVGRVVGNALQVAGDQNQVEGARDGGRITHHVRQELAKDLVTQTIYFVIAIDNIACKLWIPSNKGIKTVAHHFLYDGSHAWDIDERF